MMSLLREMVIIADNSVKDILDEWILSLCVVLSLSAIIAPLFILFGLKQGFVDAIRDQLIHDPAYRQITPKASVSLSETFFTNIEDDPRTEAVIRNFTVSASMVQLQLPNNRKSRNIEIHPTTANDPLVRENGGKTLGTGEIAITSTLAEKYDLTLNSVVNLVIGRQLKSKRQTAATAVLVVSILSPRASKHEGIFASMDLVSDIEKFRFGQSVDRADWPDGQSTQVTPMIDGLLVACDSMLDESITQRVLSRTDFSRVRMAEPEELPVLRDVEETSVVQWYLFRTMGGATSSISAQKARGELRGNGCSFGNWVGAIEVALNSTTFDVSGLSLDSKFAELFGLDINVEGNKRTFVNLSQALVSQSSAFEVGQMLWATYRHGEKKLGFPIKVAAKIAGVQPQQIIVPTLLLERLRATDQQTAVYDAVSGELKIDRLGYGGFRIYAKSIDDVPSLAKTVSALARVDVSARTDDIVRIQLLDRGLSKIVLIIMFVGLLGGSGALIASLTASVERKLSLMSNYRLIGFRRISVSAFPIVQGIIFAFAAILLAIIFYYIFSGVIDRALNSILIDKGIAPSINYIHLNLFQLLLFSATIVALSIVCSAVAVWRTLDSDPANALRLE